MSIVNVTNLTHIYGDRMIFQDAGFRLLKGEHAGLVGANGAGKSTFLRLLTGSLLPDYGNIEWQPNIRAGFLEQHAKLTEGTTILQYMEKAYERLFEIEMEMNVLAEKMADPGDNLEAMLKRYGELQTELDASGFYQIGANIEDAAQGLGLTEIGLDQDVTALSGGQRTKLLLAKLLLEEPDVLLLDEPTNYLDASHIEWLTGYLKNYEHAFLVISHDERFLNEITTVTFHLEHQTIKRYSGNYQYFLKEYAQSRAQAEAAYAKQNREIKKLEAFIDRNRVRKAKQAKSREKALSKIKRIEKPTDSHVPRFEFTTGRNPAMTVLETEKLEAGYTVPLFKPLSLTVNRGDKIAIIGENGAGKSTLIKTLLGDLKPLSGIVTAGQHLQAAYFRQESPASHDTPLEKVRALFPDVPEKDIRQTLAMSGLTPKHISQPFSTLSGGEQAKVRLAELMLSNSNLLVLDEPTNHLDTLAKNALKQALCDYKGTILLVSHEPAFYEDWVTHVWRIEAWRRK
ncbi:ABC-F family ATP-binding cassette domain-containing protein [Bacillus sonorensis]|uniref:ABC transporter ATP-binding protein YfmM n=3 Tax=Bacillus sonorensis TaxID=119858 RepID=M5PDI7_9BACI|nr:MULTISPECIES: ABC-F family ATP-binding cassette domain-containing protein [Bacillus]TWK83591.1 putative ABC transporter ATP-binding protein YbiT [Bacillus paralicheniformis]ASB91454.1 Phosphonates import ATP-binding protein PhnC [Bacillus sonorensis]EME73817.1 ABC transporter ATP-binding protein YfmM [Bacillus sonorensis L12]MBG9914754.1 ABC transporter ATP-binding protein [Bacillus sonorensis]MCF7615943.1 ATP-binding cassette domain-containing protein [Bacillus sonorensis]